MENIPEYIRQILWATSMTTENYMIFNSLDYVKKFCIPMAVTNIIYNRVQYCENLFELHETNGIIFRWFTRIPKSHRIFRLRQWLRNAMSRWDTDAKREMTLSIRKRGTQEKIETYRLVVTPGANEMETFSPTVRIPHVELNFLMARFAEQINLLSEKQKYNEVLVEYMLEAVEQPDPMSWILVGKFSTGKHQLTIETGEILPNTDK